MSQYCSVGPCFSRKQQDPGLDPNSKNYFLAKKLFSKILKIKNYTGNLMEQRKQRLQNRSTEPAKESAVF